LLAENGRTGPCPLSHATALFPAHTSRPQAGKAGTAGPGLGSEAGVHECLPLPPRPWHASRRPDQSANCVPACERKTERRNPTPGARPGSRQSLGAAAERTEGAVQPCGTVRQSALPRIPQGKTSAIAETVGKRLTLTP